MLSEKSIYATKLLFEKSKMTAKTLSVKSKRPDRSYQHTVEYGKQQGDFKVDGKWTFEVGGEGKSFEQIAGVPNSFVLADDIESPRSNKLPLWMIGLMY